MWLQVQAIHYPLISYPSFINHTHSHTRTLSLPLSPHSFHSQYCHALETIAIEREQEYASRLYLVETIYLAPFFKVYFDLGCFQQWPAMQLLPLPGSPPPPRGSTTPSPALALLASQRSLTLSLIFFCPSRKMVEYSHLFHYSKDRC